MTGFALLGTARCSRVELHVPSSGAWYADIELEEAPDVSGAQVLRIGDAQWKGTVVLGGTFRDQRKLRLVAGGGGWGKLIPAKGYHNDAGVPARLLLEDAARLAGETLAADAGVSAGRVGNSFSRQSGPASWVAQYVAPEWYVGADGVTRTGARPSTVAPAGSYEVLSYDPRLQLVTLACDSIASLVPGAVLSERLDAPVTIREMRVDVSAEGGLRVTCWTGGADGDQGRVPRAIAALVRQVTGGQLLGIYRYRVIRMSSPRVQLQAVRGDLGLPDILPAKQSPGASGWHAELAPGAEVLVQFIDGDPAFPVITGFPGKGEAGANPTSVSILSGTQPIARQGDLVMCGGPTMVCFIGTPTPTVPPTPVTTGIPYPLFFMEAGAAPPVPIPYLTGTVSTGNPLVRA